MTQRVQYLMTSDVGVLWEGDPHEIYRGIRHVQNASNLFKIYLCSSILGCIDVHLIEFFEIHIICSDQKIFD